MKKVIVASKNPVKIESTKVGFEKVFPNEGFEFEGVSVPSGVTDQPMGNEETILGASNRCDIARKEYPNAEYWVGIEGGSKKEDDEMCAFAWIVIKNKDKTGKSRTSTFYLPKKVIELMDEGKELGDADDIVFGRSNSKQENGSIGILTHDVITRTAYYVEAVVLALIPFNNPELY